VSEKRAPRKKLAPDREEVPAHWRKVVMNFIIYITRQITWAWKIEEDDMSRYVAHMER
jgi:hypothetical protein